MYKISHGTVTILLLIGNEKKSKHKHKKKLTKQSDCIFSTLMNRVSKPYMNSVKYNKKQPNNIPLFMFGLDIFINRTVRYLTLMTRKMIARTTDAPTSAHMLDRNWREGRCSTRWTRMPSALIIPSTKNKSKTKRVANIKRLS